MSSSAGNAYFVGGFFKIMPAIMSSRERREELKRRLYNGEILTEKTWKIMDKIE